MLLYYAGKTRLLTGFFLALLSPAMLVAVVFVRAAVAIAAGCFVTTVTTLGDNVLILEFDGFSFGFCVIHNVLLHTKC